MHSEEVLFAKRELMKQDQDNHTNEVPCKIIE
jgi:hypothetical protein